MDLLRIQTTVAQTLTKTFAPDGVLTDAAGPVTVAVTRLDGTAVTSGTASHPGEGTYTYALPPRATVDMHYVAWTGTFGGAAVSLLDVVEYVGGFLFSLDAVRALRPVLDPAKYSEQELATRRIATEQECEDICLQSFVPRFMRVRCSGSGTDELVMPDINLRAVRAVIINGTALDAGTLDDIVASPEGVLYWDAKWPPGRRNTVVEYEHGFDLPPAEIRDQGVVRLRSQISQSVTPIPFRALSYQAAESGGFYRLSTPGKARTGIPDVDAAYERHTADLARVAF